MSGSGFERRSSPRRIARIDAPVLLRIPVSRIVASATGDPASIPTERIGASSKASSRSAATGRSSSPRTVRRSCAPATR
ncbi:hypothetical protein ACFQRB_13350 [Halobaculum litoreum]|uniref:Uncharacterized protein n=1 Tax=Halobaculum litoreum TaxID=3031998 RepID=A0ABD5XU24_9EURY